MRFSPSDAVSRFSSVAARRHVLRGRATLVRPGRGKAAARSPLGRPDGTAPPTMT